MTKFRIKTLRLITTRSAYCPAEFSLAQRRIFSLLAYRSRLDLAISQRELSKESMTDPRTTKKVLAFLAERKLVEQREGQWLALEPSDNTRQWFAVNNKLKYDKHWSDQFSYSALLISKKNARIFLEGPKRFTANHAHVYSLLRSLGKANKDHVGVVNSIGVSRISRMLNGLSKKTIRSTLKLLESIRLIVCYQEGVYETIHIQEINNAHGYLFEEVTPRVKKEKIKTEEEKEVSFRNEEAQGIYQECRRNGMSIQLAKDIAVAALMAGINRHTLEGYSEQATLEHSKNRLAGKVSVEHHGHLLKYKLEQVRSEQDQAEKQMLMRMKPSPFEQSRNESNSASKASCHEQAVIKTTRSERLTPFLKKMHRQTPPTKDFRYRVFDELSDTKRFLKHQLKGLPTPQEVRNTMNDGRMQHWAKCGKVSPFFLLASTEVNDELNGLTISEHFGTMCNVEYSAARLNEIQTRYEEVFGYLQQQVGLEANAKGDRGNEVESTVECSNLGSEQSREDWFSANLEGL